MDTNFGTKENNFKLLKNNPPSQFEQLKKAKNEYKNNIDITAYNSYSLINKCKLIFFHIKKYLTKSN